MKDEVRMGTLLNTHHSRRSAGYFNVVVPLIIASSLQDNKNSMC